MQGDMLCHFLTYQKGTIYEDFCAVANVSLEFI